MWTFAVAPLSTPPPQTPPHLLLLPSGLLRPPNCHSDNIPASFPPSSSLQPHLHLLHLHPSSSPTFLSRPVTLHLLFFLLLLLLSVCLSCFHPSIFHAFHFWTCATSSWIPADQTLKPFTLIAFLTVTSHSCCTKNIYVRIDIYIYIYIYQAECPEACEKKKKSNFLQLLEFE